MRVFHQVLLVANPTSGGGRAGRWFDRVAAAFRKAGCEVEAVLTKSAGDGKEAARRYVRNDSQGHAGRTLVVAFGGDGTFNEVLNGADLGRCTLAVIPAGAGNVLANELGIRGRPVKAAEQLLNGRIVRFDVGVCNGRRFICVFGAGVDASVVRLVHERRGTGMTQWHYVPHVLRTVLRPLPWSVDVTVDGAPFVRAAQQVAVGNTHSYGGPLEMTPAASPNDGLFDVMCMRLGGIVDMVGKTACAYLRRLNLSRSVCYGRGRRVVVTSAGQGVPYEVDGEAAGFLPAAIEIQPAAVGLLAPGSFRPARPGRVGAD